MHHTATCRNIIFQSKYKQHICICLGPQLEISALTPEYLQISFLDVIKNSEGSSALISPEQLKGWNKKYKL